MKAYIQTKENGDWLNENCYASADGFHRMGYEIKKFKLDDTKPFFGSNHVFHEFDTREDIAHGGINSMRNLFDNFGVPQPEIHNPHEHLYGYLGREMDETTFGKVAYDFMNKLSNPIFIKPLDEHKLFTGKVINSFADLIPLSGTPQETKILQSEVVTWISEYRCFVNRRGLLGCKNYTGDFTVLPNFDLVHGAIEDYEEQPLSYSIDFGITDKGETQLIEINDGFALGAYGLNSIYYCKFIRDRWQEIMKTKK